MLPPYRIKIGENLCLCVLPDGDWVNATQELCPSCVHARAGATRGHFFLVKKRTLADAFLDIDAPMFTS
jgi:hypothetical protein